MVVGVFWSRSRTPFGPAQTLYKVKMNAANQEQIRTHCLHVLGVACDDTKIFKFQLHRAELWQNWRPARSPSPIMGGPPVTTMGHVHVHHEHVREHKRKKTLHIQTHKRNTNACMHAKRINSENVTCTPQVGWWKKDRNTPTSCMLCAGWGSTYVFKLTMALGIPVGVLNAGINLSAISTARRLNISSPECNNTWTGR